MLPWLKRGVGGKSEAAVGGVRPSNHDPRYLPPKTVVEQISDGEARRTLPLAANPVDIGQANVVRSVADDHIVQERGRKSLGHAGHHADSRSQESVLNVGKAILYETPRWRRRRSIPSVMDVAERRSQIRRDGVVYPEQLFPPVGGRGYDNVVARIDARIAPGARIRSRNHPCVQQRHGIGIDACLVSLKRLWAGAGDA